MEEGKTDGIQSFQVAIVMITKSTLKGKVDACQYCNLGLTRQNKVELVALIKVA